MDEFTPLDDFLRLFRRWWLIILCMLVGSLAAWVFHRATDRVIDSVGRNGRSAGQFHWVHNLAVDSRGNIYTAEVDTGKRAQKFVPAR